MSHNADSSTGWPASDIPQAPATRQSLRGKRRNGWWWKTLIGGILLWIVTAVVTFATGNTNLVPTVILLGSFLVPFCVMLKR